MAPGSSAGDWGFLRKWDPEAPLVPKGLLENPARMALMEKLALQVCLAFQDPKGPQGSQGSRERQDCQDCLV